LRSPDHDRQIGPPAALEIELMRTVEHVNHLPRYRGLTRIPLSISRGASCRGVGMNPGDIMIVFSLRADVTAVRVSVSLSSRTRHERRNRVRSKRHGDQ
ncbi:MAG TPA: hypothetical protein VHS97_24495, partial [Isosphaeraceae bacterium]|nr:hypothetical protein [Isosphaeraceae bacterium]